MAKCDNCPQRRGQKCVGTFQDIETSIDELQNDIVKALKILYRNDKYLLDTYVNEVCITSHIFHYFASLFSEKYGLYNIDPEYNRFGMYSKFYDEGPNGRDRYAKPDMLIHKRNCNKHNLLYVEFKPYWNDNTDDDYRKIKKFVSDDFLGGYGDTVISYRYRFGVSVLLDKKKVTFAWFRHGTEGIVKKVEISTKTWEEKRE